MISLQHSHCLQDLHPCVALQALQFYRQVQELPDYNDKELWNKIAECYEALGDQEGMITMYEAIMQDNSFPAATQHDAAVALTHLHLDAGDTLAAEQVCRRTASLHPHCTERGFMMAALRTCQLQRVVLLSQYCLSQENYGNMSAWRYPV